MAMAESGGLMAGSARFGADNFQQWTQHVEGFLAAKGLRSYLEVDAESEASTKVLMWLAQQVTPDHRATIRQCRTAAAAWEALKAAHKPENVAQLLLLQKNFQNIKKGSRESISQYVTRAMNLASKLEAAGDTVGEQQRVRVLLEGLPPEYDVIHIKVAREGELPTLEKLYRYMLLIEGKLADKALPSTQMHATGVSR